MHTIELYPHYVHTGNQTTVMLVQLAMSDAF